jgi:L-2-hydroxyglutarate oxidase LhgO
MTDAVDTLVVGAGVVGLAVARALAAAGRDVILIEKHRKPGQETSSRNSGVIHSGIYYPAGSLKARSCVRGRTLLYAYCKERAIAHRRCGKLIVAQEHQISGLRMLAEQGVANGVTDLTWLASDDVRRLEPQVRCASGLWSPSTGIIDVHEYVIALQGDVEAAGGQIVFDSELVSAKVQAAGIRAQIRSGAASSELDWRWLINCTGLHALGLLTRIDAYPAARRRRPFFAKGSYFVCQGARPFSHLVYPMPNQAGLGLHATLGLDGVTRFGPDVEWVAAPDYAVDAARAHSFYAAIREYWPGLADGALQPAYAGVRPKLVGPDAKAADFELEGPAQHGVAGLINLLGIESPGLTSSLAIAEDVARMIKSG